MGSTAAMDAHRAHVAVSTTRGSPASTPIWRPRAPRSPRAICRRWARSRSGARCACTPPRWPPTRAIIYWNPATLAAIAGVRALRDARRARVLHHRRRPARQGAVRGRRRGRGRRRAARSPRRQRDADRRPGPGARVVEGHVTGAMLPPWSARPASCSWSANTACSTAAPPWSRPSIGARSGASSPARRRRRRLVAEAVRRGARAPGCERHHAAARARPRSTAARCRDGGGKLGLGSSAAAAAVARRRALLDAAGYDPDASPRSSFALADRAHRAAQGGRGSGADVAAAVLRRHHRLRAAERHARRQSAAGPPPTSRSSCSTPARPTRPSTPSAPSRRWRRAIAPRHARRIAAIARAPRTRSCAALRGGDARRSSIDAATAARTRSRRSAADASCRS